MYSIQNTTGMKRLCIYYHSPVQITVCIVVSLFLHLDIVEDYHELDYKSTIFATTTFLLLASYYIQA